MWIDLVRTCQSVLSMEVWILTLKGKKVDPDQASLERKKIRTDEHNNIWFAQSKFTPLLDVFCIFFDEQNNMFPPVQVDPAQPSQLPLRGASRKVPESPGGAQRVHPPAQESWKIQTCRCNCFFRAQRRKFFYQGSLHPGLIIENAGYSIFCFLAH